MPDHWYLRACSVVGACPCAWVSHGLGYLSSDSSENRLGACVDYIRANAIGQVLSALSYRKCFHSRARSTELRAYSVLFRSYSGFREGSAFGVTSNSQSAANACTCAFACSGDTVCS